MIWLDLFVWKHYPSKRSSFKQRKQWLEVFFFSKCAANFWKSLVEYAIFRKRASPEMLFQKFAAYLQNTYFEEHLDDFFQNRCFSKQVFLQILRKTTQNLSTSFSALIYLKEEGQKLFQDKVENSYVSCSNGLFSHLETCVVSTA